MRHIKAQRGEARYPQSHSKLKQRAKAADQVLRLGTPWDSGGSYLADTWMSCLCLLHLLSGLQTHMTEWPTGAPQVVISQALQTPSVPLNSLSLHPQTISPSSPYLSTRCHHPLGFLCPKPGVSSAPRSPSPSHPPSSNSVSSVPLESASLCLCCHALVFTSTIPAAPCHGLLSDPPACSLTLAYPVSMQQSG